jgi:hypothetical protein
MTVVYCDLDAIHEARRRLSGLRDQVRPEVDRHANLASQASSLLDQMARTILPGLDPQHWFDPQLSWGNWGLGRLAGEILDSHRAVDAVRSQVRWTIEQLQSAHGSLVGGAIGAGAADIDPGFGRALDIIWDVVTIFNPGNLLWLLREPWALCGRIEDSRGHIVSVVMSLEAFIGYLGRLEAREKAIVLALAEQIGAADAPVIFGVLSLSADAASALTTPQARQGQGAVLRFLETHYKGHAELVALSFKHNQLTLPEVSADVDGAIVQKSTTTRGHFGFLPTEHSVYVAVGAVSAGVGAKALTATGPEVGASADVTAVKARDERVLGSRQLGLTAGAELDVGSADGFAGLRDGEIGAEIGASPATLHRSVGVDVAGYNIGVEEAMGWKWEWGLKIGKVTEVKLPFVSLGFTIGKADN